MKRTSNRFSPEVREQAVRMVREHGSDHTSQWAASRSALASNPQALLGRVTNGRLGP
jgi:transposase-like protein